MECWPERLYSGAHQNLEILCRVGMSYENITCHVKEKPSYTGLFRIFEYSEQFGAVKCNIAHKIVYSADGNVIMMKEKEFSEKRGYQKDTFLLHFKQFSK